MKKIRILYLNHNTWNFVLQRSQVLALELQKHFECTVADLQFVPNVNYGLKNNMPKRYKKIYQLRGAGKIKLLKRVNSVLYKAQLRKVNQFDCIWICHPLFFNYIPNNYSGCLIYDCMDDHSQLCKPDDQKLLIATEKKLVKKSAIKFVSSENLKHAVYGMKDAVLVRNGFIANDIHPPQQPINKQNYKIGYFGAIESWMDFSLMLKSKDFNVEYHIIGPLKVNSFLIDGNNYSIQNMTENSINFEGLIDHDSLWEAVEDYDALFMPFVVNELILSVDPVKLYEYIAFGKCVISVWYPEIDRFSPYVYFYHSHEEYLELLNQLIKTGFKPKYNKGMQEQFLKENSWEVRGDKIKEVIQNYFENRKK